MLNPGGYAVTKTLGEKDVEQDVELCAHCSVIMYRRPGLNVPPQVMVFRPDNTVYFKDVDKCLKCNRYKCPRRACVECTPYEKKIDMEEKAARFICT